MNCECAVKSGEDLYNPTEGIKVVIYNQLLFCCNERAGLAAGGGCGGGRRFQHIFRSLIAAFEALAAVFMFLSVHFSCK